MKEVAEQLLEAMRTALEAKKAGKRGNYQGILNKTRQIFDSTMRQASGTFPELKGMIVEAERIQKEGVRINGPVARASTEGASRPINLADAFEFQQKKRQGKLTNPAAAEVTEPKAEPLKQEDSPEAFEVAADPDLIAQLANLTPAKLRDNFGGQEGLRVFARELFNIEQEDEQTDANFQQAVLRRLKALEKPQADV